MANNEPWQWSPQEAGGWLPEGASITIDAKTVESQMGRMREVARTQQVYRAAISEITTKLETLDAEFRIRYEHNPIHHIDSRLKSLQSILEKLKRIGLPPDLDAAKKHLLDIAGVRVICNYIEDIYDIAEMLENQGDITPLRRRDYIAHPKENGYRSLHLIVRVPVFLSDRVENVPVEVQIRTIAMDFWASLEHELRYKSSKDSSEVLRERLMRCAEASAALDLEMQAIRNEIFATNLPRDRKRTS